MPINLKNFLSNPILGGIGWLLTVVSIGLAIFFYIEGKARREIRYYCYPVKATIFDSKEAGGLDINFGDKKVDKSITAAQLSIWNSGKLQAEKNDVLMPLEIYTDPPVQIINTTTRNQSRDVVGFILDRNFLHEGRIPIAWNIMEENDGARIQLIYFGDTNVKINIRGVLRGQKNIIDATPSITIGTPNEQFFSKIRGKGFVFYGTLIASLLMIATFIGFLLFVRKKMPAGRIRILLFLIVTLPLILGILLWIDYFNSSVILPPV